jgi:outer membrane receptor for ferrienterochelin and colicin
MPCKLRPSGKPRRAIADIARRRVAAGIALSFLAGSAVAQSTSGSIFGQVPVAEGETVVVTGSSGVTRSVPVDASGRYNIGNLQVGSYGVALQRDGVVVASRKNVTVRVGSGVNVSFSEAEAGAKTSKTLQGVVVSANRPPAIDVTNTDSRTVITADQLAKLPLARSAEAIAMLAPGTVSGSSHFKGPNGNGLVSFGGASVTENAYYLNGMNVTDPLNGLGGISLPYGSIEQEEVLTGGYGAAYGRSDGGVINQVGKRGTNEWHFGGQVLFTPKWATADQSNIYFPRASGSDAGSIHDYNRGDKGWTEVEDAYLGGPLIKDKLFLFASVEGSKSSSSNVSSISSSPTDDKYQYRDPKWYAKLDWNINESNILELTGASTKHDYEGNTYQYDYDTHAKGDFITDDTRTKTSSQVWIAKYTGYITDDLTVTAQYGKQKTDYYTQLPSSFDPDLIAIYGASQENPALSGGGGGITNRQNVYSFTNPNHETKGANYRFDVTYKLGDHTITAGIDNQRTQDLDDGSVIPTNAGYAWSYSKLDSPTSDIVQGAVDAPVNYPGGENGYYVSKYDFASSASVRVEQRAQYIEDAWQVNDRLLLKLGLRNDQFTNYNNDNQPFIRQTKPQWAPRLGASWDVNGDSSFKVYANAGRYYLAMPTSVALRGANGSLFSNIYYTYTGIDPNGNPTGLTPVNTINGPGVAYSANGEDGTAPDPRTVTSKSLEAEYQDEYVAGFDKQFNASWNFGAKLTLRRLKNAIDDTCQSDLFQAQAAAQGLDADNVSGCYFINPGRSAQILVPDGNGGYGKLDLSGAALGLPHLKRNYYALNMYLEHPFDGKWWGRLDYTFSRSYGNSEGQVKSDTGQSDIAATIDWDYPQIMEYSNGRLPNDRTHQLKAYGAWQITPEWNLSGNLSIASGSPTSCFGLYGPDQTVPNYGNGSYHWCNGVPAPAGTAGDLPWQKILSLNVEYRPAFADHKLAFSLYVYNVLDEQHAITISQTYDSNYRLVSNMETPRYLRFGATYDF